MQKLICILAVVLLAVAIAQGQPCSGTMVGNLPNLNHEVSGVFYIEDTTTYCIDNFFYDGGGPDAFLYLYYVGDDTFIKGGGVITPVPGEPQPQFEFGRPYNGEIFRFQVPEGHRTCDYGGFGIWCRYASQLFTVVVNMQVYFSEDGSGNTIQCTPSPGRAFLGALTGGITGDLFAVSDTEFSVRNFNDPSARNIDFYGIPVGGALDQLSSVNLGAGILDSSGRTVITVPAESRTCDFGSFAAFDTDTNEFIANSEVEIDLLASYTNNMLEADHTRSLVLCDRPTTRPGVLVGELPRNGEGLEGTFYVQDDKTFYIQLFSYSASFDDVYPYYYREGQMVEDTGHGYRIGYDAGLGPFPGGGFLVSYKKITPFIVNLNWAVDEEDVNTCDVSWFTVYSSSEQSHFTRIEIPPEIFTTDDADPGIASRTKVLCSETAAVPTPRTGGAPPTSSLMSFFAIAVIALMAFAM